MADQLAQDNGSDDNVNRMAGKASPAVDGREREKIDKYGPLVNMARLTRECKRKQELLFLAVVIEDDGQFSRGTFALIEFVAKHVKLLATRAGPRLDDVSPAMMAAGARSALKHGLVANLVRGISQTIRAGGQASGKATEREQEYQFDVMVEEGDEQLREVAARIRGEGAQDAGTPPAERTIGIGIAGAGQQQQQLQPMTREPRENMAQGSVSRAKETREQAAQLLRAMEEAVRRDGRTLASAISDMAVASLSASSARETYGTLYPLDGGSRYIK